MYSQANVKALWHFILNKMYNKGIKLSVIKFERCIWTKLTHEKWQYPNSYGSSLSGLNSEWPTWAERGPTLIFTSMKVVCPFAPFYFFYFRSLPGPHGLLENLKDLSVGIPSLRYTCFPGQCKSTQTLISELGDTPLIYSALTWHCLHKLLASDKSFLISNSLEVCCPLSSPLLQRPWYWWYL